jgi:hypothetical protein
MGVRPSSPPVVASPASSERSDARRDRRCTYLDVHHKTTLPRSTRGYGVKRIGFCVDFAFEVTLTDEGPDLGASNSTYRAVPWETRL